MWVAIWVKPKGGIYYLPFKYYFGSAKSIIYRIRNVSLNVYFTLQKLFLHVDVNFCVRIVHTFYFAF